MMLNNNLSLAKNVTNIHSATLGLVLGSISFFTVIMNILVLYAVKIERKLHTVGNLYIVSLSIADLIVGVAVMPLNIVYLLNHDWILGRPTCLFWLSMDYVASTASIFSLFILCIDRYRSIQQPLQYLKYRTKTRALVMISGAWLLSLTWIIPILGWHVFANGGIRSVSEHMCETEFHKVTWFKVLTAILNFYIPSLLMLWFYAKIYKAVREHYQHRELINGSFQLFYDSKFVQNVKILKKPRNCVKKQCSNGSLMVPGTSLHSHYASVANVFPKQKSSHEQFHIENFEGQQTFSPCDNKVVKLHCFPLTIIQANPEECRNYVTVSRKNIKEHFPENLEVTEISEEQTFAEAGSCILQSNQMGENHTENTESAETRQSGNFGYLKHTWQRIRTQSKQNFNGLHMNRERKAAKQLGFIMAAFMLCWIPYFVLFMVIAFCQDCFNHNIHMFTIWLGYINSTLNPLIYPLCNENFKKTFKKIFHLRLNCGTKEKCTSCTYK
ncbi:histamine H1 receptor [Hyla sarda]|uniref:histamine H1 receptor n=1 Tax=Hyla sarda TaxID=327740 RepID=UPI0024C3E588|nr:histamine H1 receptor [Hyla sarda]XP_056380251.1 histamine H1 receptor [Hyla sarda]XP_056380252.1 histamine H1 receptor [Hyla sarda]XP_056380253.1 histamine H1 receptor [Hyla sarda]XP_056380254.1 histamine H1 receptor [Hyla sarda]XP_056380255.1 histamine H1 receptor [Hyla sarda]XP_056380256.1 histamine H1 receptor [Hyla sarda]XP_056380257.1 histamine H1 receptor [Hyla sarda]XP_056380258.1 histamine H1 receptor [Hyla sarda]XP_056380259.1 histamine H1 receptor [Hyla sarda]XP_056380260.1 